MRIVLSHRKASVLQSLTGRSHGVLSKAIHPPRFSPTE
jgi:hypothetical protein